MNRILNIGFFGEGRSDTRFVFRIVQRLLEELLLQRGNRVDINPTELRSGNKATRLVEKVLSSLNELAPESVDIVFIHQDGGSDPVRARKERYEPIVQAISGARSGVHTVAVIPVKESEAWALVDGDALREAFECTLSNADLGIPPRPAEVEKIQDPKKRLADALRKSNPGRKNRRRPRSAGYLAILAEIVTMEGLRHVPAFKEMEGEIIAALEKIYL